MDGRFNSAPQYQPPPSSITPPPGDQNKFYPPSNAAGSGVASYNYSPPPSGYGQSSSVFSASSNNLMPPLGPPQTMSPSSNLPPTGQQQQFSSSMYHQPPPSYGTPDHMQSQFTNPASSVQQPNLLRHVSSNQMLAVGIRSPDSNGHSLSSANLGISTPIASSNYAPYASMPSPGSGSYSTLISGMGPPSPAYMHQPPSPPTSGYGLPPTSGGYYPYQSSPAGQNPPFHQSGIPPPPPPSSSYDSYNPNANPYGPPQTMNNNNQSTPGVAADPSFYGHSPSTSFTNHGLMPQPPHSSGGEGLPPLRTTSNDSNSSPSPSRSRRDGGSNVKRVNSRIDPSQMPRPIRPTDGILYQTNSGTTTSSGRKIPPTSCTNFRVLDTGNCSPRCMRLTTTAPPATKEIANMTGIPIAMTATPFASPEVGEEPVPIVDAGENPPRCSRCRGYVNPHVVWTDGGNKWACNLCSMVNTTPSYYYSSLDGVGLRLDRKQRPELTHGTVDFLVGKDFSIRSLQEPLYVYAIDISQRAVASGLTISSINAIRNSISYLQGQADRIRVGIITFDRTIHYYQVKDDSISDPVRVLVTDSDDPFAALPYDSWMLPLSTRLSSISILLDKIPELIPAIQGYDRDGNMTKSHPQSAGPPSPGQGGNPAVPYDEYAQTCPIAVIKSVQQGLANIGGKLILFTSFSSNIGYGKITSSQTRDTQSIYGTPAELGSYSLASIALANADSRKASADEKAILSSYIQLACDCSKSFLSVDIIVASESEYLFPDYALLSEVSEQTGGNFHVFTGSLLIESNMMRLQQQLMYMQQCVVGFEVMMKVRCSTGFRVEKFLGRGSYDDSVNELEVASINSNSTYCCVLKHDGSLKDDDKVYVQLAVLYTSAAMSRRCVRVHNIATTATTTAQQVFRHADLDATVDVLMKVAIDKALRFPLTLEKDGPRAFLTDSAIEILQKYRTHCSPDSSRGQLILPESLKLLPLYTLCALKHPALLDNFPGGLDTKTSSGRSTQLHVRGYERAYELRRLRSLPANQLMNSLYPRLYSLHQLDDNDGELIQLMDGLQIIKMPTVLPSLSEIMEGDGLYLLDDGGVLWLYIGRNVATHKLEEWFGLPISPNGLFEKSRNLDLNVSNSYEASKMASIINNLRQNNWSKQELKVMWAGENYGPDSTRFGLRIIEDSVYGNASYVDFLCKIHAKIQSKGT